MIHLQTRKFKLIICYNFKNEFTNAYPILIWKKVKALLKGDGIRRQNRNAAQHLRFQQSIVARFAKLYNSNIDYVILKPKFW